MKITDRFPSIQQPQAELEVSKFKGPDSAKREIITLPEQALDALEGARNSASSLGRLTNVPDVFEGSSGPRISSQVEKYKGPDSIELPQRSSRVDKYEGPDSLTRPEIESQVEKYKGPKSIFDERGSRVENYKGPDSAERQIVILPDHAVDAIETLRNAASSFSLIKDPEDK